MNWSHVPLGEILAPAPVRRAGTEEYPILSMTMSDGLVLQSDKFKKRVASRDTANYRVVKNGELVVGFPIDEAVLAVQRVSDAGIVSPAYKIWTINTEIADELYIERYLRSEAAIAYYVSNLRSSTARRRVLPDDKFRGMPIPLPSLEQQKKIVAILDRAENIHRKREQALDLADEFFKSVFLEMFGDPVTNPKGWKLRLLGDVGDVDRGKSRHRPRNDPRLLGGPYPFIQTGDVARAKRYIKAYRSTYSEMGLVQSKLWPKGTLCITIAANIADTGVLEFDACFPDSVVGFVPGPDVTTEYVQQWFGFLKSIIEAKAPKSAQSNINLAILRNLELPVPHIKDQEHFSNMVANSTRLLENLTQDASAANQLLRSLSQRAFRGEL